MKAIKKILAIVVCLCICLGCLSITAMAATKGSITIKDPLTSEATVAGKTFDVYKIFNATTNGVNTSYKWYAQDDGTIPFKNYFFGPTGVLGKNDGKLQEAVDYVLGITEAYALSQFAESLHQYIIANNVQPIINDVKAGDDAESVVIPDLDYGYYLVYDDTDLTTSESSVRSAVMLSNVNKDAEITLKANRPQISKHVLNNEDKYAKGTSSTIGDKVSFLLETTVPDHSHYTVYNYSIEDTMPEGLALDADSIVVKSGDTTLTKGIDYDLDTTGTNGTDFIVTFKNVAANDNASDVFASGKALKVTYDAVLTQDAEKVTVNTATLVYSNDPTNDTLTGEVSDTANVYSYQFVFTKFAQDPSGNLANIRLAGAEFELYERGSSDPIWFVIEKQNEGTEQEFDKYVVVPAGTPGATKTLKVHDKGPETESLQGLNYGGHLGDVVIFGLAEGYYDLKETVAPDGYVLPEDLYHITITDSIDVLGLVGTLSITATHQGTGSIVNMNGIGENVLTVWAEITNKIGTALPETGGMGTTLFTILGVTLMAGALAFFTLRKRGSAF